MHIAPWLCTSGTEADLYRSLPLDNDTLSIRILEILPGSFSQPLSCRLIVKQVTGITRYEALSYTWGNAATTCGITVNSTSLPITENLECALRHLRLEKKRRRIWCDALCINQLDLQERATQVMKMGQIYRNAERVLVWLGAGIQETSLAFQYIRWCNGTSSVDTNTFGRAAEGCCPMHFRQRPEYDLRGFECPKCKIQCACIQCHDTRRSIRVGLEDLAKREWWSRIWVVQEVAMAAGDPLVGCGQDWVPWSHLVRYENAGNSWPGDRTPIAQIHQIRLDIRTPARLRGLAGPLAYSSEAAEADDVFHWLQRTASLHASDPRDKVYALLGMARNKRWRELVPDYSISTQDLQYKLVSRMIELDKNLDILVLCRPRQDQLDLGVATWIPNFHAQGLPFMATMDHLGIKSPLRMVMATLSSMGQPKIDNSNVKLQYHGYGSSEFTDSQRSYVPQMGSLLRASGFQIDVVRYFLDETESCLIFKQHTNDARHVYEVLKSLFYWAPVWRAIDPTLLRDDDGTDADTFIAKLGVFLTEDDSVKDWRLLNDTDDPALRGIARKIDRHFCAKAKEFGYEQKAATLEWAMDGRKFFATSHGLLGIGPAELEVGDVITVLNGSSTAFALRRRGPRYVLVGNVFVDMPHAALPWLEPTIKSAIWTPRDSRAETFEIW